MLKCFHLICLVGLWQSLFKSLIKCNRCKCYYFIIQNWEEGKRHDPNDLDLVITPMEEVSGQQKRIIDLVKEKLLQLESGIERRYLKPPFTKRYCFINAK